MVRSVVVVLMCCALLGCDKPDEPGSTGTGTSGTSETSTTTVGMTGTGEEGGQGSACTPADFVDPEGWAPCDVDADCALCSDCCSCGVHTPKNSTCGNCGGSCGQDKCEELGFDRAVCREGHCAVEGRSCNQMLVTCADDPPDCGPGTLPRVWDGCWVGDCLPLEQCDWVPDCSYCGQDEICVLERFSPTCEAYSCAGIIEECKGSPPCCVADYACQFGTKCSASLGMITCQ